MATKGIVKGIVSNLVTVEVDGPVSQNEICYISVGGVKLMAEEQKNISEKVDKIDKKMTTAERKPAERWDNLVDKIVWLLAGAAIIALFAQAGIAL